MKFILHIGPIHRVGLDWGFRAFCPAEGEATTQISATQNGALMDFGATKRGIEMAGGKVVIHGTCEAFDEALREHGITP